MRASCSRTRRTSVPAGRLRRCRQRREISSAAPIVRARARVACATTSKYMSLRVAASIGSPIARSRRRTARSQSGRPALMTRRPPGMLHCAPPSTVRIEPVVKLDASLARYSAAPAISSAMPARRSANVRVRAASTSLSHASRDRREERAGHDRVDAHVRPSASAKPTVMALSPAFAAAYGTMSPLGRTAPVLETLMIEPPSPATMRSPTRADSRNGPLRLTRDDLVEQLLGARGQARVQRGDAGVVHEHVDALEGAVGGVDEALEVVPAPDVARAAGARPPPARSSAATCAGGLLAARDDDVRARRRSAARSRGRARGCRRSRRATRPERSNSAQRRPVGLARLACRVRCVHRRRLLQAARSARRGSRATPTLEPDSVDALADAAGGEQQLEVADDLPDDEQRLLGDGPRRPEMAGDAVGGARAVGQDREDPLAAPAVVARAARRRGARVASPARRGR